jgi:hypothetical protein
VKNDELEGLIEYWNNIIEGKKHLNVGSRKCIQLEANLIICSKTNTFLCPMFNDHLSRQRQPSEASRSSTKSEKPKVNGYSYNKANTRCYHKLIVHNNAHDTKWEFLRYHPKIKWPTIWWCWLEIFFYMHWMDPILLRNKFLLLWILGWKKMDFSSKFWRISIGPYIWTLVGKLSMWTTSDPKSKYH